MHNFWSRKFERTSGNRVKTPFGRIVRLSIYHRVPVTGRVCVNGRPWAADENVWTPTFGTASTRPTIVSIRFRNAPPAARAQTPRFTSDRSIGHAELPTESEKKGLTVNPRVQPRRNDSDGWLHENARFYTGTDLNHVGVYDRYTIYTPTQYTPITISVTVAPSGIAYTVSRPVRTACNVVDTRVCVSKSRKKQQHCSHTARGYCFPLISLARDWWLGGQKPKRPRGRGTVLRARLAVFPDYGENKSPSRDTEQIIRNSRRRRRRCRR